jgi:hypothetical protein
MRISAENQELHEKLAVLQQKIKTYEESRFLNWFKKL